MPGQVPSLLHKQNQGNGRRKEKSKVYLCPAGLELWQEIPSESSHQRSLDPGIREPLHGQLQPGMWLAHRLQRRKGPGPLLHFPCSPKPGHSTWRAVSLLAPTGLAHFPFKAGIAACLSSPFTLLLHTSFTDPCLSKSLI